MSLKCPFLTQFAVNEIKKNASTIWKSAYSCPFMTTAVRMLSDDAKRQSIRSTITATSLLDKANELNQQPAETLKANIQQHKTITTTGTKCPFGSTTNTARNYIIESNKNNADESINLTKIQQQFENVNLQKNNQDQVEFNENSFDFDGYFTKKLEAKKRDHTYRYFKSIIRKSDTFPVAEEQIVKEKELEEKREITIWCSNDYLGLGRHPYVKDEVVKAVETYGAGSGGTRNISGSTPGHTKLEKALAKLHQKEAALLFTSCYVANDTTLFTLAKMLPNCHIFSDAGNHASMIQGIRNSGVPKHIFRHNDAKHLEELLKKVPIETPKIVAFESVHSMDGSICNVEEMCDITHKYGGLAFIDEVHAVGLYGQNGAGVGERDGVLHKMDIITGTLGKAFGNVGGYIAGTHAMCDTIRSFGAGFIFTTSLPPSVASGALASIKISCSDEGRQLRAKHQHNAAVLKKRLIEAGIPVMKSASHIVPVFVGNAQHASDICNILLQNYGIYIQSINYPTVARGEERLRIVPTPLHTEQMIDDLVNALVKVWSECDLKLRIDSMNGTKQIPILCTLCKSEEDGGEWKQLCKNLHINRQCAASSA